MTSPQRDPTPSEIVENVHVEWFSHLAGVKGLEVHCDTDIAWKLSPASAWSNCGVRLRFSEATADARLNEILSRYRENGRGAGFWVGPSASPHDLASRLKARRLHCRKYYPAMYCDLREPLPSSRPRLAVDLSVVDDYDIFRRDPHPAIGRLTTPFRRFELQSQQLRASISPRKSWELMAGFESKPAGICTVFIGNEYAGLFDVAVLEPLRNRGIGRTLVQYACSFARDRGAKGMILIATNAGYRVYGHAGFKEVSSMGFWYTAHP